MTGAACPWCSATFEPRTTGGSPQRFCTAPCRRAFDTACRVYAATEIHTGRLPVSALKMALGQCARWLERDPRLKRPQAPAESGSRPGSSMAADTADRAGAVA